MTSDTGIKHADQGAKAIDRSVQGVSIDYNRFFYFGLYVILPIMSPKKAALYTFVAAAVICLLYFILFTFDYLATSEMKTVHLSIGAVAFVSAFSVYRKVESSRSFSFTRQVMPLVLASVTVYLLANWIEF